MKVIRFEAGKNNYIIGIDNDFVISSLKCKKLKIEQNCLNFENIDRCRCRFFRNNNWTKWVDSCTILY